MGLNQCLLAAPHLTSARFSLVICKIKKLIPFAFCKVGGLKWGYELKSLVGNKLSAEQALHQARQLRGLREMEELSGRGWDNLHSQRWQGPCNFSFVLWNEVGHEKLTRDS